MSICDPWDSAFDLDACFCSVLRQHIERLEAGHGQLHVPHPEPIPLAKEWQHFHLIPEMFFQLSGSNDFRFPSQRFQLGPGEVIVLPRQLAHQETAHDGSGGWRTHPFCNIVLTAYEQRLSYHVTVRNRDRSSKRQISILNFDSVHSRRAASVLHCMNELVRAQEDDYQYSAAATRALSLSLLYMLLNLIEHKEQNQEQHQKITQCIEFIDYHIGNSMLSVNVLANWLGCHPDYLSKLFHQECGERLNSYITGKRMLLARQTLRESQLSVAQIAHASGFQDPAYFSRSFKKHVGVTPLQYRKQARK